MKAVETSLLKFLENANQFRIPIYQRTYSWTQKECRQLWEDILRAGKDDKIEVHFVGSIVYIQEEISQISRSSPWLVIDGQQRLTTLTLLLTALSRAVGNDREPIDGFSASKIRNRYLVDKEEEGDRHYKLLLTQTDEETLKTIVSGKEIPPKHSIRVKQNYELFENWLKEHDAELEIICRGISKLIIVDITLTRDQDNPQRIFESMNSTGRELSQADLIRNFILMELEPKLQNRLYTEYWRPMEMAFGQEAYTEHFDDFMRHYLTVKTGSIPRIRDIYEAFKEYAYTRDVKEAGIEKLIQNIRRFANYYCAMALEAEQDTKLKTAFHDLRELKVNVAYPFLLALYQDYAEGKLSMEDFEKTVRLIESYTFRRAICDIPTSSLNKTFLTFTILTKSLKKDSYLENIQVHFLTRRTYRRFPKDEEFYDAIQTRDLYHFSRSSFLWRKLENYNRKEHVPTNEYTIEHIMPQNTKLSQTWQNDIGENWEELHEKYLHRLGNLTLTGYNSEYSDKSFIEKRDMKGGFKDSPLRLNANLGQVEKWNEEAIKTRGARLADEAVKVWPRPHLSKEILEKHTQQQTSKPIYSIDNHFPSHNMMRELFEDLRREILALDPYVSEEFLKRYIAYKAETNFVDIVPKETQLKLILNMQFPDINDPRGICRDISGLGGWGNGDVEVRLSQKDEIPYIMGVIRQSLEQQFGDDGRE